MNKKIIRFLREFFVQRGMTYTDLSEASGIDSPRLRLILEAESVLSASELICLCRALEIDQKQLMALVTSAA